MSMDQLLKICTKDQLAKKLNVTKATVNKWYEQGWCPYSKAQLIEEIYKIPAVNLVKDKIKANVSNDLIYTKVSRSITEQELENNIKFYELKLQQSRELLWAFRAGAKTNQGANDE